MKRERRDRVFLAASALAGLGGMVAVPMLLIFLVGVVDPLIGMRGPENDDQRLTNWLALGGLIVGFSIGPFLYFLTSRPRDRRSVFHWWRLIRIFVVVVAPFFIFFWQLPGMSTMLGLRVALWLIIIIPPLWLPDAYRYVMPRVRSGYYQRARWVRRNGVPRWCNLAIAGVVLLGVASVLPKVLESLDGWHVSMLRRGSGMREYAIWILLIALALAIPYVLARLLYSTLMWKLDDAPGHCRRCGYDLTKNESGICPECGVEVEAKQVSA